MATIDREQLKDKVLYSQQNPAGLADVIISVNENTGAGLGTLASLTTEDKTDAVSAINEVAAELATEVALGAKQAIVKVAAGQDVDGTIDLVDTPSAIIAVLAVTTASGAVATKFLLAATTDYTVATHVLTCKSDQSANTLIIIYK